MKPIWSALLAVNVAWALHLVVSYYLAWAGCAGDDGMLALLRHLATFTALGVAGVAVWRGVRDRSTVPAADNGVRREEMAERGFLATLTVALSLILLLAIVLAGTASLALVPCV
jgi:hypothetical protein